MAENKTEDEKYLEVLKALSTCAADFAADGVPMSDDVAFEIAANFMSDEPWLKPYVEKRFNVVDVQGYLADRV